MSEEEDEDLLPTFRPFTRYTYASSYKLLFHASPCREELGKCEKRIAKEKIAEQKREGHIKDSSTGVSYSM